MWVNISICSVVRRLCIHIINICISILLTSYTRHVKSEWHDTSPSTLAVHRTLPVLQILRSWMMSTSLPNNFSTLSRESKQPIQPKNPTLTSKTFFALHVEAVPLDGLPFTGLTLLKIQLARFYRILFWLLQPLERYHSSLRYLLLRTFYYWDGGKPPLPCLQSVSPYTSLVSSTLEYS